LRPPARRSGDRMELDPVQQRVLRDRAAMGRAAAHRLAIGFAGSPDVLVVDGAERHQFDRVHLDPAVPDPVLPADLHLRSPPPAEGHRDPPGKDVLAQLAAELHASEVRPIR